MQHFRARFHAFSSRLASQEFQQSGQSCALEESGAKERPNVSSSYRLPKLSQYACKRIDYLLRLCHQASEKWENRLSVAWSFVVQRQRESELSTHVHVFLWPASDAQEYVPIVERPSGQHWPDEADDSIGRGNVFM